jgi:hypothetical protein
VSIDGGTPATEDLYASSYGQGHHFRRSVTERFPHHQDHRPRDQRPGLGSAFTTVEGFTLQ